MTESATKARDYSETLFLPKTEFPMRAGLPQKEPALLERWQKLELYERLRADAKDRPKFVLHDGPPYANGNIHIGHALNKILKDVVTRSQQMLGFDSNYVPGWDCHGLPIEWKIEGDNYRSKAARLEAGLLRRRGPRRAAERSAPAIRRALDRCTAKGISARLGVIGDWAHPLHHDERFPPKRRSRAGS